MPLNDIKKIDDKNVLKDKYVLYVTVLSAPEEKEACSFDFTYVIESQEEGKMLDCLSPEKVDS